MPLERVGTNSVIRPTATNLFIKETDSFVLPQKRGLVYARLFLDPFLLIAFYPTLELAQPIAEER